MKNEKFIPALSYDWLTPLYDPIVRLTTREKSFKKALVEQAGVTPGHRILDLACGTGTLAVLLKKNVPEAEIIGVDGDPKILKLAKEKARAGDFEIRFDKGMSFDLPYADASFDRVVSSLFFHHLTRENKLKTLGEVLRILKAGGELHIADWGLPTNFLMRIASRGIEILDGADTTKDNFKGLLPSFVTETGFKETSETQYFNSLFGTISLLKAKK